MADGFNWNDHPIVPNGPAKSFSWDDHPVISKGPDDSDKDYAGMSAGDRLSDLLSGGQKLQAASKAARAKQDLQDSQSVGTKDNPISSDIFGSDADRIKSSFGNPSGVGRMLLQKGFVDFDKNKDGDMVVKDASGKWHKDENGLLEHPINSLESGAGKALPMAAGIGAGTAAGLASLGAGAIPAAAAGGAAGEGARIGIGKAMGVNDDDLGDAALDMGKEGLTMGAGEAGGMLAKPAIDAAAPMIASGAQAVGSAIKAGAEKLPQAIESIPPFLRHSVTGTLEYSGIMHGRPGQMIAGALLEPGVQRGIINKTAQGVSGVASSPLFQAAAKDPHFLQAITNPELRDLVSKGASELNYDPSEEKQIPIQSVQAAYGNQ